MPPKVLKKANNITRCQFNQVPIWTTFFNSLTFKGADLTWCRFDLYPPTHTHHHHTSHPIFIMGLKHHFKTVMDLYSGT